MALETLKDVKEIGGFEVREVLWIQPANSFIEVNPEYNSIVFRLQKGPIKEVGVNGCQVDTMIEAAKMIIDGLNQKHPCEENAMALAALQSALEWLAVRTKNRTERGVEGTSAV